MQSNFYDFIIIGAGIVGSATAYKLQQKFPDLKILLIEKEKELAYHQTGHNSGVIHSGIYYKPGSLKAKNCVKGRKELIQFAKEYNIKHDICGKIIVATNTDEIKYLDKIYENGIANNIEGIEKIDQKDIKNFEPYCNGIKAIYVPCTGIIDFKEVTYKMIDLIKLIQNKSTLITGEKVINTGKDKDSAYVNTNKGKYKAKNLIFCAGLQADRLAKMTGIDINIKIIPFRGDYYELKQNALYKVRNLIYPVPHPDFPFLGVHFTRMINGGVECGPNAVFNFSREDYKKLSFNLKDFIDSITYKGTLKLFVKHWKYGLNEYKRDLFKKSFLKSLKNLIPSLEMQDIKESRCGIRAQAIDKNGNLLDDFYIVSNQYSIHVINAPSPAATSSLSIAEYIVNEIEKFN